MGTTKKRIPVCSYGPFRCPDCEFSEHDPTRFVNHLAEHQNSKILTCVFCKFEANTFCLSLHMAEHSVGHSCGSPRNLNVSRKRTATKRNVTVKRPRRQADCQVFVSSKASVQYSRAKVGTQSESVDGAPEEETDNVNIDVPSQTRPSKLLLDDGKRRRSSILHRSPPAVSRDIHLKSEPSQSPENNSSGDLNPKIQSNPDPGVSSRIPDETLDSMSFAPLRPREIFKCEKCTFSALRETLVKIHYAKHHAEARTESGKIDVEYLGQSRPASPQRRKMFRCEQCAFETPKKLLLQCHSAKHLLDPSLVCTHCGVREVNPIKFAKHLASSHSSKRRTACCFCSYSSPKLKNLARHLVIHRPVRLADCPECGMTFSKNSSRNAHYKRRHMKSKRREEGNLHQTKRKPCSVASKDVMNDTSFAPLLSEVASSAGPIIAGKTPTKGLSAVTNGIAPLAAKVASPTRPINSGKPQAKRPSAVTARKQKPKSLPGPIKSAIKAVEVTVPSKPFYQCASCEFSSKRKDLLKRHVAKHLLPGSFLVCPLCQFAENSAHVFIEHMTSHDPKNRLECCFCFHKSSKRNDLRRHLEVHRSVHFYDCPICGKTYKQFLVLRKHCKEAHVKNVRCPDGGKLTLKANFRHHRRRRREEQKLNQQKQKQHDPKPDMMLSPKAENFSCSDAYQTSTNDPQSSSVENGLKSAPTFQCDSCGYATDVELLYTRHCAKHDLEEAKFSCPTCDFKPSDVTPFVEHLRTHDDSTDCCFCEFKADCKSRLIRHLETHRSVHFNDCPLCDKSYSSVSSLNEHVTTYHVQKRKCQDCGELMTRFELLEHIKTHAKSFDVPLNQKSVVVPLNKKSIDVPLNSDSEMDHSSKFRCYHCKYCTSKKALLRRHASKHLMDTRIVCPDCNFGENSAREFAKHLVPCQAGFFCSFCSYSTSGVKPLGDHVQMHRNVTIYDCTKCEYSTYFRSNLRGHYETQHVVMHQCNYCDKTMSKYQLNRHKAKHLASAGTEADIDQAVVDREEETLRCGFCYFTTNEMSTLSEHFALHLAPLTENTESGPDALSASLESVKKSLLCGYCDFGTDSEPLLVEHLSMHAERGDSSHVESGLNAMLTKNACGQKSQLCENRDFTTKDPSLIEDHSSTHSNLAKIKDESTHEILASETPNSMGTAISSAETGSGMDFQCIGCDDNTPEPDDDDDDDDMCIDHELSGY